MFVKQSNMKPLISVIIPVYNEEGHIKNCLDSILRQTYKEYEVILVDDGSTDKSSVICDEYAMKNYNVFAIHISNSGIFQARKTGAQSAQGKILTFLDADDWIESNAFETAVQIYNEYNPDIFAHAYIYENSIVEENLYEERLYCKSEIEDMIIPCMMFDSTIGKRRLNPSLCCKYMKKEIFSQVTQSVTDRVTLGEDALVTYPAVCMAKSIFICNKTLYHYSNNSSSCTHSFPPERVMEVKAFQQNIIRLFGELGVQAKLKHQVESYIRTLLLMMIKNWYAIELSPVSFSFPYDCIIKESKVFIYGAGNVGKSYINELKISNYANIAGWADKNYKKIQSYNNIKIINPKLIKTKSFDVLLIAMVDEGAANSIKNDLINMGIDKNKIIWKKPIFII